jgi:hypothetical protein
MLLFLSILKLVFEIALLSLLGQGFLFLLAGERRDRNVFYQLLQTLTRPFTSLARRLTPSRVADRHVPFVAFFLLAIGWVVVTIERIRLCVSVDMVGCR